MGKTSSVQVTPPTINDNVNAQTHESCYLPSAVFRLLHPVTVGSVRGRDRELQCSGLAFRGRLRTASLPAGLCEHKVVVILSLMSVYDTV